MHQELRIINGSPILTTDSLQDGMEKPFFAKINILGVLLANTELNVLNGFKKAPEGRVLGNVSLAQVSEDSINKQLFAKISHISSGMYVVVSSHAPCFKCVSCQTQHWDECKDLQQLGWNVDGTATTDAYLPIMCFTPIPYVQSTNGGLDELKPFLMTEMVAKSIWLATQDFVRKDLKIGAAGRAFPIEVLSNVVEDFSNVAVDKIHHVELGFGYSSALTSARYDVLIDYDGDGFTAENVATLLKPGGVLVSPANVARQNALERLLNRVSFKMLDFEQSSPFLAIEWISQNPQVFQNKGGSIPFDSNGLQEIKHHEVLREKNGFIFFDVAAKNAFSENIPFSINQSGLQNEKISLL